MKYILRVVSGFPATFHLLSRKVDYLWDSVQPANHDYEHHVGTTTETIVKRTTTLSEKRGARPRRSEKKNVARLRER